MPIYPDDVREHAEAVGVERLNEEDAERIASEATEAARAAIEHELSPGAGAEPAACTYVHGTRNGPLVREHLCDECLDELLAELRMGEALDRGDVVMLDVWDAKVEGPPCDRCARGEEQAP